MDPWGDVAPVPLGKGAVVGNYIIEELRAQGGLASVYRARHVVIGRTVALKVLHRHLGTSSSALRRFQQEAQVLGRLRHPNLVDIFDFGDHEGAPYLVMEWLCGPTLGEELGARGPLTLDEIGKIFLPLGSALAAAHRLGVVHRDIKASNVVLADATPGGMAERKQRIVKLIDFGIAKLLSEELPVPKTTVGTRLGTPASMAPEQILGDRVDARTDIYALGVLLFQAATGKLPFAARSQLELDELHLSAVPPRPSEWAPAATPLDGLVLSCLEKSPEARPSSVEKLMSELEAATAT